MTVLAALSTGRESRLDLGHAVARAAGELQRNWLKFAVLSLLLAGAPYGLFSWALVLVKGTPRVIADLLLDSALREFVAAVVGSAVAAAMTAIIAAERQGRSASYGGCLSAIAEVWGPLLVAASLRTLALFAPYLNFIPSAVFASVWPVVSAVLVVKGGGAIRAFGRSAALTRGSRWRLLLAYVVLFVLVWLTSSALSLGSLALYQSAFRYAGRSAAWVAWQAGVSPGIGMAFSILIAQTWAATLYFELRTLKEGIAPETLASVFD